VSIELPGIRIEMKNSRDGDGTTFSTRIGKTGFFLLTARSISRATKADSLLAFESTRIRQRALSMPRMISSP
jgi:hypothetical protein